MQYVIVLTRHAETEWNVKGLVQGHKDSPLTAHGVQGAEALAQWLAPVSFTHVVSSDLQRAIRTSDIIMAKNTAGHSERPLTVVRDERIRERSFGTLWSGKPFRELYAEASRCGAHYPDFAPSGVESLSQLRARASDFFARFSLSLAQQTLHDGSTPCGVQFSSDSLARLGLSSTYNSTDNNVIANVLLVTHGGIIRELLADLASRGLVRDGLPPAATKLAPNCCYSTIVVTFQPPEQFSAQNPIACIKEVSLITANVKPPEQHTATSVGDNVKKH